MRDNRTITCVNSSNIGLTFGDRFSPFLLVDVDGIYSSTSTINSANKGNGNGADYIGTTNQIRNIVLTLKGKNDHSDLRDEIYRVFVINDSGTFTYSEGLKKRKINYYVESIDIDGTGNARTYSVSLKCLDPLFNAPYDTQVILTGWNPNFEFVHEFTEVGEQLGYSVIEKLKRIDNESSSQIGFTATIVADGTVINPSLYLMNTGKTLKVGTSQNPFEMSMGEKLIIKTVSGEKGIYHVKDGITTKVNEYLDDSSTMIQLSTGTNYLRYYAEDGEDNMQVSIVYRAKFTGC